MSKKPEPLAYDGVPLFLSLCRVFQSLHNSAPVGDEEKKKSALRMCLALLDAGADPNLRNDKGYAPLHVAATVRKQEKCVKI